MAAESSREEGCMLGNLASQRKSGGLDGVWETFQGSVFIDVDASPHWSHSTDEQQSAGKPRE